MYGMSTPCEGLPECVGLSLGDGGKPTAESVSYVCYDNLSAISHKAT